MQRDVPVARLMPIEKNKSEIYCQRPAKVFRFLQPVVEANFDPIADLLEVNQDIALRASEPFATPLVTLDALHLATAIKIREAQGNGLAFASFDNELAIAAMVHGFAVVSEQSLLQVQFRKILRQILKRILRIV